MKLISLFFLLFSIYSHSNDLSVVAVGKANINKRKIAFQKVLAANVVETKLITEFHKIFGNDFSFYKDDFEVFALSDQLKFPFGKPNFEMLKEKGYQFFTQVEYGAGHSYKLKSYNVSAEELSLDLQGFFNKGNLRKTAHTHTNDIYKKIVGKDSIFLSKIFFVSDKRSYGKRIIKELYSIDFDGFGVKELTKHRGFVLSPAVSRDQSKVLYSLIRGGIQKRKNIDLYLLDLKTMKSKKISSRRGINSGAIFIDEGENIVLTLSHTGNAEIFRLNLKTGKSTQITKNYAPDVDPSMNVDGTKLAFLSGRPGAAHIYTLDPSGVEKSVERISYVGKFNATPRFSPDGKEIAFSSWLDNRFDIFRVDSTGNNLVRLTKNHGSNEDPSYSSDGQFIVFSSQKVLSRTKAVNSLYIMTRNGDIIGNISEDLGNCITPRWSK